MKNIIFLNTMVLFLDCFNGTGSDYSGFISQTIQGAPCVPWKNVQGFEHMSSSDVNYCRNPKIETLPQPTAPWCFTSLSGGWDICAVRQCTGEQNYKAL